MIAMNSKVILAFVLAAAASTLRAQVSSAPIEHEDHIEPCNLPFQFEDRSTWAANLWPSGIVPYTVNANVTSGNAALLRAAMDELESYANIQFVPRTNQSAYIMVQNSTGNNSSVGRTGGQQTVNLFNWTYNYIICHELMHALGVWHEQQRPDRGSYVTINTGNIQAGYSGNFSIRNTATTVGPFDFESIMLYDGCAFSNCCGAGSSCGCALSCSTMQCLPAYAQYQNTMGNRLYISEGDKAGLVARYGAPPDDQYENNDTQATASNLWAGPSENLILGDDDDWFRVPVSATTTLSATYSGASWSYLNVVLTLHNASGAVIQTAYPSDSDFDGNYTATATRVVAAGTYYIHVHRGATLGGPYTLTVSPNCDSIDFNNDGLYPDTADIDDMLSVFSGGSCSNAPNCHDIDFNNDGLYPDTADIDQLLLAFSGGGCL